MALIDDLVPPPDIGRMYSSGCRVRLADVNPKGRARLDALARFLQDIANDDAVDGMGMADATYWVVRRTVLEITRFPVFREDLTMTTWGSGIGSRFAERRTSITGNRGAAVEAAALWVHVEPATGRPARLPESYVDLYADSVGRREVSPSLVHPRPEPALLAETRPWPVRVADFDPLGHMNNTVYWQAVEEHLVSAKPGRLRIEMEYRAGIDSSQVVEVALDGDFLWLLADGVVAASARVIAGT